ncbi:unnamed protein product [Caretta caretta]
MYVGKRKKMEMGLFCLLAGEKLQAFHFRGTALQCSCGLSLFSVLRFLDYGLTLHHTPGKAFHISERIR